MTAYSYGEPSEGAIEFARQLTEGLSHESAGEIIEKVLSLDDAELADKYGQKVKRCVVCRYPFRDPTKNGSSTVCGEECKTAKKSRQKAIQRGRLKEDERKPVYYIWWLEYPYWTSEKAMLSRVGSYERPYDPSKLVKMDAARERKERHGNKRHSTKAGLK